MQDLLSASFSAYDNLARRYGKVSVVGFSMGGAIALFLASGRDVHKLALISPYFKVRGAWYYFGSPEAWARRLNRLIPFVKIFKAGQINDPAGLSRYSAPYSRLPTRPVANLSELGKMAAMKAQESVATIWIHSRGDFVADFDLSKKTFDSVPVREKCMVEYERSNHVILYDYDSDDAIRRTVFFLRSGIRTREGDVPRQVNESRCKPMVSRKTCFPSACRYLYEAATNPRYTMKKDGYSDEVGHALRSQRTTGYDLNRPPVPEGEAIGDALQIRRFASSPHSSRPLFTFLHCTAREGSGGVLQYFNNAAYTAACALPSSTFLHCLALFASKKMVWGS